MPKEANIILFLAVFLIALLVQSTYFQHFFFIDYDRWIDRTLNLANDILTPPAHLELFDQDNNFRYGPHPGTAIILPAALFYKLGLSVHSSLLLSITLLTSFLTAAIVSTCHYLRPHSFWWLVVAAILCLHPLYFYGTPTNVVFAPIIPLLTLLALVTYEQRTKPLSLRLAFFIAFVIGLGLSVRLHTTLFFAPPLLAFIASYTTPHRLRLIIVAAVLFAILLNPLYWFVPVQYTLFLIKYVYYHLLFTANPGSNLSLLWALYYTPLSIISLLLASLLVVLTPRHLPVPKPFLLALLLITSFTVAIFVSATAKTLRYFYSLIFLWDILFPLFLLHLVNQLRFPFIASQSNQTLARRLARLFVAGVIIFGYGYLTAYNLLLPGTAGLI